jgi:hypothetical protein
MGKPALVLPRLVDDTGRLLPVYNSYTNSLGEGFSKLPLTATSAATTLYQDRVNPQWVRLLNVLELNVRYTRCLGT